MKNVALTMAALFVSYTLCSLSSAAADEVIAQSEALALFEQRIMPIFR